MNRFRMLIALALMATPIPVFAQAPDAPLPARGPGGLGGNAIGLLLERRAELALTAEQVTRLESIQTDLEERNAPILEQLGGFGGALRPGAARQGPGVARPDSAQREAMRDRRAELEPLRAQLMENNREALQAALAVLTPEQQQQARAMLTPGRPENVRPRGQGAPGGPAGPGRPGGAPRPDAPRSQRQAI